MFAPIERFAYTLSLFVDVPVIGDLTSTRAQTVAGNRVETDTTSDRTALNVGLQFGLQGRF